MSTSQNGWPVLQPDSPKLFHWDLPGSDEGFLCRNGSAGFLLVHCALWFDNRVEDIDGKILDDWGYAYRVVRGYGIWSNHASGTAIDLNAMKHPLGAEDTFLPQVAAEIRRRVDDFYDGCIRWGGEYNNRKDEMHFEIDKDLAACEKKARQLLDSPRGIRILKANPSQRAVILS